MNKPVQSWEVDIRINGESVLTIGGLAAAHVAGIENIDEYADIVREAASHLESFIGHPPVDERKLARAAIEAMRVPTSEMLVAGRLADEDCDMPGQVWRAMIDAALKPTERT